MMAATSRRTALLIATAAAALLVLLCATALDGQGLNYDEVHQVPAAYLLLGKPAYTFVALAWRRIPLLTMPYSGAVKSALFALWVWISGVPFTVVSWRLFGIVLAAAGLWTFCVLSAAALTPMALAVFAALFVSDVTVLLLVRHDWGPVVVSLMLRFAWIGLWIRSSVDERPHNLSLVALGAIPSFLVYEKLNNVVLLGPFAVMAAMVVTDRGVRIRRAVTIATGFLIGLIPFAIVNVIGHGISFHAAVQQPPGDASTADVVSFVLGVLALGDGEVRQYILGVPSPAWARAAELAFFSVGAVFVTAAVWTRGWRDRDARLAAASLAAYAATIALIVILIMRISSAHHWIVATPFQYLAVAFSMQALVRAGRPRTPAIFVLSVLALFLAARVTNVVALERDLAARRTSPMFDASFTTVAQYAVDHRDDATFIAADWGFGTQIYALSNGTLSVPEPFWNWGSQWGIGRLDTYITERDRPTFVLALKERSATSPGVTADIVRSVEAIADGKSLAVDPVLARSPVIRVLKFAPPPPPPTGAQPCSTAPDAPTGVRVETNGGGFVALAWNPPAARPDAYILDIGNAPGAGTPRELGRWPAYAAGGVPRGTYYVRVRAKNACGASAASPELTVVVQ